MTMQSVSLLEQIARLETENARLRTELDKYMTAFYRERNGDWPAQPWPDGASVQPAPIPRGVCISCATKIARGEQAICGCITSGPQVTCR